MNASNETRYELGPPVPPVCDDDDDDDDDCPGAPVPAPASDAPTPSAASAPSFTSASIRSLARTTFDCR